MVWGMLLPSGFGDFSPQGSFEGDDKNGNELWGERLKDQCRAQTPDVQKALFDNDKRYPEVDYPFFVGYKFINEPGTRAWGEPENPPFTPVLPKEAPRSWMTKKSHQALGSLIEFHSRIVGVNEPLKDVIERLEPRVHQFFPLEIRKPRGKVYPGSYYTLLIGQYCDSFSPDQSREG